MSDEEETNLNLSPLGNAPEIDRNPKLNNLMASNQTPDSNRVPNYKQDNLDLQRNEGNHINLFSSL